MNVVHTPINDKFIDENGILNVIIREDAEITLENIMEDDKANYLLTGGKKVRALIDARANFTATKEASDYIRSGIMNKTRIATAIVSGNLASRLIVNFFLQMKRPDSPTKMFRGKEEAIEWLLKQE